MKLWWGTQDYNAVVAAANNLQDAISCIQNTKHFYNAKINPNPIGFINTIEKQAYITCNSYPIQHDDEPNDEYDNYYADDDELNDAGDDDLEF
jgi:hypothetical protein